jgi:hypothetical protein
MDLDAEIEKTQLEISEKKKIILNLKKDIAFKQIKDITKDIRETQRGLGIQCSVDEIEERMVEMKTFLKTGNQLLGIYKRYLEAKNAVKENRLQDAVEIIRSVKEELKEYDCEKYLLLTELLRKVIHLERKILKSYVIVEEVEVKERKNEESHEYELVRQLGLSGDSTTTTIYNPDLIIHSSTQHFISTLSTTLTKISILSSNSQQTIQLKRIRDYLTLYTSLREIEILPHILDANSSCLFYNDYTFISYNLNLFLTTYSHLNHPVVRLYLDDFYLYLDQKKQEILSKMLQPYEKAIKADIKDLPLNSLDIYRTEVESCLDSAISRMKNLSFQLKPILIREKYLTCLNNLIESLFSEITDQVLSMKDICTEDCPLISQILSSLLSLDEIFIPDSPECTSWPRLETIVKLLDTDLDEIVSNYKVGKLKSLSIVEVRGMIKAMFQESSYRNECLKQIV